MGNAWKAFKQEELPDNYFRIEVIILRCLGIELWKEETLLYKIFSRSFLFFLVFLYTFTELYELYAQMHNVDMIVAVMVYLLTHITGGIKTMLLMSNRQSIGNMLKSLHQPPFKPSVFRGGDYEEKAIRSVIKKTEIQLVVYFIVILGTICSGAINSITVRITKDKSEWKFPYVPTISIVDLTESPWFEIGCFYEIFCVLTYAGIIATIYVLLSTIMAHISVQLKILRHSFRNLKIRAERMQRGSGKNLDYFLQLAMKESVQHHMQILDLTREMETLCSMMILVVFISSVILLCFLLYAASLYPFTSIQFFQNFCYWWIIVCQIGMYCYWGNEVSLEAENIAAGAAEADWVGATPKVSKTLVLVIARAQRPLYITAGKFVPLGMPTFMNMIKGSFSYFTVLRQTQEGTNY